MLEGAVLDDLDQLDVLQHLAVEQDGVGDLDLVVGQGRDELVRCVQLHRQPAGKRLAHRHFHVVDQLAQNVGHERAFALVEDVLLVEEQIADDLHQPGSPADRLVPGEIQQFLLGDTRSLDDVVRELAEAGSITSFCTAGYRCGRTGRKIMKLLRSGKEGQFCKLNAVLTFREWLDDFASPETIAAGEKVIAKEIAQVRQQMPEIFDTFMGYYEKTRTGERDLYF